MFDSSLLCSVQRHTFCESGRVRSQISDSRVWLRAQLYIPVSNCLMWANHLHELKSHSLTLSPFTICTFAVNKGGWGDREKSQRVWLARCPPRMLICIKWLPSTLELFSTSSCRQMRLAVRRGPRSVSVPD